MLLCCSLDIGSLKLFFPLLSLHFCGCAFHSRRSQSSRGTQPVHAGRPPGNFWMNPEYKNLRFSRAYFSILLFFLKCILYIVYVTTVSLLWFFALSFCCRSVKGDVFKKEYLTRHNENYNYKILWKSERVMEANSKWKRWYTNLRWLGKSPVEPIDWILTLQFIPHLFCWSVEVAEQMS